MSGQYGNRGRGRGGRGGRGKGRSSTWNKPAHSKKSVEDYFFYVGSNKQATDYELTSEFVLNHIKKTFDQGNDIAEALRTLVRAEVDI